MVCLNSFKDESVESGITILNIVTFIFSPLFTIYSGFVLSKLWLWFLVPLGIFQIGTIQGIGIVYIFSVVKGVSICDHINNGKIQIYKMYLTSFIFNTLILFFGYIYSQFL